MAAHLDLASHGHQAETDKFSNVQMSWPNVRNTFPNIPPLNISVQLIFPGTSLISTRQVQMSGMFPEFL